MVKKWELNVERAMFFTESMASCTGCTDYAYLTNREDYIRCVNYARIKDASLEEVD